MAGRVWKAGDKIINERLNGLLSMPEWVESGCAITVAGANSVNIATGVAYLGGMRITVPVTTTGLGAVPGLKYIHAEATATIVDGKLKGVGPVSVGIAAAPKIYPIGVTTYGVLLGTVRTDGAAVDTASIEETHRGIPTFRGSDVNSTFISVAPKGGDYEAIERAIADANSGDTLIVYAGANLVLSQNVVITKNLNIVSAYTFDPRQNLSSVFNLVITAPGVSSVDMIDVNNSVVYIKGIQFHYSETSFRVGSGSIVILDHCLVGGNTDPAKPAVSVVGGSLGFHESKINATTKGMIVYSGAAELRGSRVYALGGPSIAQSAGTISVRGSVLNSPNVCINQSAGTINWDNASVCEGNNNPNVIGGTLNSLRVPQDLWETARLADINIPKGTAFPGSPVDGDFYYRTDLDHLFRYDSGRGKWLGEMDFFRAGRSGILVNNTYLRSIDGMAMSATLGTYVPNDVTLVGFSWAKGTAVAGDFEVRRNGVSVAVISDGGSTTGFADLNDNFATGGIMSVYWTNGTNATNVQVKVHYRRRAT